MSATTISSHQDWCSSRAKRGESEDPAGRDRGGAAVCRRLTTRCVFLLKSINLEGTFKLIPNYDTPSFGSTQKHADLRNRASLLSPATRRPALRARIAHRQTRPFTRVAELAAACISGPAIAHDE